MKIVITLGGNALLRRGEALSVDNQRRNIEVAARALARLAAKHDLVLSHGNGPQVGLLALQNEAYARENPAVPAYPFDVLGAESQAMVGYMFAQALSRALQTVGSDRPVASILTQSEVDPDDPAFVNPSKFIGAMMTESEAKEAEREHGWRVKQDGKGYRRVIASPRPLRIVEFPIIKNLVDTGTLVISCGGGGVPVIKSEKGLQGVEAKDAAEILLGEANLETDIVLLAQAGDEVLVLLDLIVEEDDLGAALDDRLDHAVEASGDFAREVDLLQTLLDRVKCSFGHLSERPSQTAQTAPITGEVGVR